MMRKFEFTHEYNVNQGLPLADLFDFVNEIKDAFSHGPEPTLKMAVHYPGPQSDSSTATLSVLAEDVKR